MNSVRDRGNIEWYLLGLAAVTLFAFGVAGFLRHAAWHSLPVTLLDSIYLTLQLIPLNSGALSAPVPVELELARFLLPALAAVTAIKAALQLFSAQIRLLKLRWISGHVIVCGLSRKGLLLASQFRKQGSEVVVIERDEENDWIASCQEQDIIVLNGDAADPAILLRAGVLRAACLLAVVEDDGINAEIVVETRALIKARTGEPLVCLAHIADPQLCALLRERENNLGNRVFQMTLFNVFEQGARGMVNQNPAWTDAQLENGTIPSVLVVGLGLMGENVIVEIARDWWNQRRSAQRVQIVLIDRDANARAASLQARYPQLAQACDLTLLQMDVHSAEYEQGAFLKDKNNRLLIGQAYICLDDDSLGLHAALMLLRHVPNGSLPVVIRMKEENGLAHLLADPHDGSKKYRSLSAFAYLDYACTPTLLTDTPRDILARAAHEDYIQEHSAPGLLPPDDPSLQPWERLDEEYRQANYAWVDHIRTLLAQIGYEISPLVDWDAPSYVFSDTQVDQMARSEHENWMRDRLDQGWKYALGPKDLRQRTNPLLVSWEDLSEADKAMNRSLVRRIPAFLSKAGFQVKITEQSENL